MSEIKATENFYDYSSKTIPLHDNLTGANQKDVN